MPANQDIPGAMLGVLDHDDDGPPAPPSRWLLGDVIVHLGFCDRDTVESAVIEARTAGRMLGQLLQERRQLTSRQLSIAIAERYGLRFASRGDLDPDVAALQLVSHEDVKRLDAVPIAFGPYDSIIVAIADPRRLLALDELMFMTDRQVEAIIVMRQDLDALLARVARVEGGITDEEPEPEPAADVEDPSDVAEHADDGLTIKLVRSIIADAIEQGASDVHFDPRDGGLHVRYRVDGILRYATRLPADQTARVISRIKILSDLDISERRAPQDGRTSMLVLGRRIDMRVAILPLVNGESAVIRVLDHGAQPLSLDGLGMAPDDARRLKAALAGSHGAILATGPTGSGKSSSLHAALAVVASEEKAVITIEDPVEHRSPDIKQMQIHGRAGVTFATGLRAIVRADPDVIMVGEIRDGESAKIAIEAALTGHQVFSSVHTNSAAATPARLIEMGVEPYLVASAVTCVVAQRLARRLCSSCRRPVTIQGADAGLLDGGEVSGYEADGCEDCQGTGYRGRVGLFEVMSVSAGIRALVSARASADEVGALAIAEGMTTLLEDGLRKVRAGVTSLQEVQRVVG